MREVYIDGDVFPYQIGFATQRTIYQLDSEGLHSCSPLVVTKSKRKINKYLKIKPDLILTEALFAEQPMQVINTLKLHLSNVVRGSKCHTFKVVMSGKDNFRDRVATIQPYKGNRVGMEKPVHFDLIREWLLDKPYTIVSVDEEADDVISRAMIAGHVGASPDKDLNNTPGSHYNFRTGLLYEVSESEARHNFYRQMLVGDVADHIPGIKGIGPKTADKLLSQCKLVEEYEHAVFSVYEKHYHQPISSMKEVGQLLWMRRYEDETAWEPFV